MKELYFYRVVMVCLVLGGTFLAGHHYGDSTINQLADLTGQPRMDRPHTNSRLARVTPPAAYEPRVANRDAGTRHPNQSQQNQYRSNGLRNVPTIKSSSLSPARSSNMPQFQPTNPLFQPAQYVPFQQPSYAPEHAQNTLNPSTPSPNTNNYYPQPNNFNNQPRQPNYQPNNRNHQFPQPNNHIDQPRLPNYQPFNYPPRPINQPFQPHVHPNKPQPPLASGKSGVNRGIQNQYSPPRGALLPTSSAPPENPNKTRNNSNKVLKSTPAPRPKKDSPKQAVRPNTTPSLTAVSEIVRIRELLGGSGVGKILNPIGDNGANREGGEIDESSDSFRELLTIIANGNEISEGNEGGNGNEFGTSNQSIEDKAESHSKENESIEKPVEPQKSAKAPKPTGKARG